MEKLRSFSRFSRTTQDPPDSLLLWTLGLWDKCVWPAPGNCNRISLFSRVSYFVFDFGPHVNMYERYGRRLAWKFTHERPFGGHLKSCLLRQFCDGLRSPTATIILIIAFNYHYLHHHHRHRHRRCRPKRKHNKFHADGKYFCPRIYFPAKSSKSKSK